MPDKYELRQDQRLDSRQPIRRVADTLPAKYRHLVENECAKADVQIAGYQAKLPHLIDPSSQPIVMADGFLLPISDPLSRVA